MIAVFVVGCYVGLNVGVILMCLLLDERSERPTSESPTYEPPVLREVTQADRDAAWAATLLIEAGCSGEVDHG